VRKLWVQINWHFNFLRNDAFRFSAAACFVVVHLLDCRTCLGVLLLCDIAQKVVENLVNILARLGRCLDVLYFPLSCTSFCFFQWNLKIRKYSSLISRFAVPVFFPLNRLCCQQEWMEWNLCCCRRPWRVKFALGILESLRRILSLWWKTRRGSPLPIGNNCHEWRRNLLGRLYREYLCVLLVHLRKVDYEIERMRIWGLT